jgi:outer membrane immunogenic protein
MRMRKAKFVALYLSLLSAFALGDRPANAADLDWRTDRSFKDEPIVVPRYGFSWTGYYLGGNLGYSWGDSSTFDSAAGAGFVVHPLGWAGGLQGGYNWQMNNILAGVEVDLGILGATDKQSSATRFVEAEYGSYGTLSARLGMTEDRWLFYLKGGLALANIENRAVVPGGQTDSDETRVGYTIGGGAEYAFRPDWSMKIEYMYMNLGDYTSGSTTGDVFRHDNELSSVKIGVNYRFQPVEPPLR